MPERSGSPAKRPPSVVMLEVLEILHLVPLLVVPVQRLAIALTLSHNMYRQRLETSVRK